MARKNILVLSMTLNVIFVSLFIVGLLWADSNGIWENAKDIRAGTFGSDEGGGNYAFPGDLLINNNLVVKNNENVTNLNVKNNGVIGNNLNVKNEINSYKVNTTKIVLNNKEISSWPQCVATSDCYTSPTISMGSSFSCKPTYVMTGFKVVSSSTYQVQCCRFGTTVS